MSYLFDTDICSAHLKLPGGLQHRFIQHAGRLFLPAIVLGGLYAWAYHRNNSATLLAALESDLLVDVALLPFDDVAVQPVAVSNAVRV